MITLAETLKLVEPECDEKDLFYIKKHGTTKTEIFNNAEEVRRAFDVENTYVVRVRPHFVGSIYEGLDIEFL